MFSTANSKIILLIVALIMYPNYLSAMEQSEKNTTLISHPLPAILPSELMENIVIGIVDNSTNIEEALCSLVFFKLTDKQTRDSVGTLLASIHYVTTIVQKLSTICAKDYSSYPYPPKALAQHFIRRIMNISIPNPDPAEDIHPEDLFRKAYNADHKRISKFFFLESTNKEAKNYFFYDCVQKDDIDAAKFCLKHGADVNTPCNYPYIISGMTPLIHAVENKDVEMVRTLLPFNPNQQITIKRKWGIGGEFIEEQQSMYEYAKLTGNAAIVKLLKEHNNNNNS